MNASELQLPRDGAQLVPGVFDADALREVAALAPAGDVPGARLFGSELLRRFLHPDSALSRLASRFLGPSARPVRALFFSKSGENNWRIGWHQDRTIAVRRRIDAASFDVWSVKGGVDHVEPPFEILAGMVTLRLHLDDTPATNAPLLIAPGSHALGYVAASDASRVANRATPVACTAAAGDVWVYATAILHSSERAATSAQRRVLHVDYAATDLPHGLEWFGV